MIKYELKERVAESARLFWEKKLSVGKDGGDLSLRDPETNYVYICPKPGDKLEKIINWGITQPEHIVVIDLDGNKVEDNGIDPTVEWKMHTFIYKSRPEVNAIVHPHAEYSSAFAVAGKNIPHVLDEMKILGGEVVCAEYGRVNSTELAENIVKALGKDHNAALLRNHGSVAIGKTMQEAFLVSDYMERQARVVIWASILGKVTTVDEVRNA